ncbi:MAG: hypothetical protein RJA35_1352 [Actinomycetota bacterium]
MNEYTHSAAPDREAWDGWRAEIQSIGVTNPLLSYEFDPFCQIDLDRAHPGGMAQFSATGASTLSNLVRDPLTFSKAHAAAKRIDAKAHQLRDHFGLETCYLVGGLISLEGDGFDLRMPILLWPIQLIRIGEDYEVRQSGQPMVNPALGPNLDTCYGVKLNETALLSTIQPKSDLVPIALLDHLSNLIGAAGRVELKSVLALGNFTTAAISMAHDVVNVDVPLLDAIAAGSGGVQLAPIGPEAVHPVMDADEVQRRILARAVAGQSFAVETLPGCGYTQTVLNTLAALTAAGKRALVLAPRRQTLNELADRLSSIGLGGLLVRSDSAWMDTIAAISRNEKAKGRAAGVAATELQETTNNLGAYFTALRAVNAELGVSILDVLEKLAELSLMPHAPQTKARIARASLLAKPDRQVALDLLGKALDLGEFKYGPQDSAWFQARFDNPADVTSALATVKRLRDETYPTLVAKLNEFIAAVEFRPAGSVSEIGAYLRLFSGIRDSLDRFVPNVFDRSLTEVIAATGPKQKGEMSGVTRRRLKKLAKEFIRPGMHVADINASLRNIEMQREAWQQNTTGLKPPSVPNGINDAMVTYQALVSDLDEIQRHLDPRSTEPLLTALPLDKLAAKLNSLVEDTGALENLGERSMVANELRELGLEDLMRDFARLHVSREHLASEFDLAWWQSSLEYLATKNPVVLGKSVAEIETLEEKFRAASDAVLLENRVNLADQLGQAWRTDIQGYAVEATALKDQLKTGVATLPQLLRAAPRIATRLMPNLALSPYEVAEVLTRDHKFDTLIILDAAGTSIAENLSGFLRADQVIAFGDDAIAVPSGFEVEARPVPIGRELASPSALSQVANTFGSEVLRRSYRTYGQILGAFINREFYQNRIIFEPTADDYWGNSRLNVEIVANGAHATSNIAGANQSLDAEVEKAVELIYNHALWHPEDSLLLATASPMHADRVRAAVFSGLKKRQHLMEFFEGHGREKFEVSTLSSLSHRVVDHVIFSVGFGKTPKGAILNDIGDLTAKNGRRYLANLLVSARKQITVVSCFSQNDLPDDATNGIAHLRDLLGGGVRVEDASEDIEADAMLLDLAVRLRKLGVTVKSDFGQNLTMVASYGNKAVELQPDWVVSDRELAQEINLRPRLLKALGWQVKRVHSFELFADPERFAREVAESLGLPALSKAQQRFDDEIKFEDTDAAWGDYRRSGGSAGANDDRLKQDKPPHWG